MVQKLMTAHERKEEPTSSSFLPFLVELQSIFFLNVERDPVPSKGGSHLSSPGDKLTSHEWSSSSSGLPLALARFRARPLVVPLLSAVVADNVPYIHQVAFSSSITLALKCTARLEPIDSSYQLVDTIHDAGICLIGSSSLVRGCSLLHNRGLAPGVIFFDNLTSTVSAAANMAARVSGGVAAESTTLAISCFRGAPKCDRMDAAKTSRNPAPFLSAAGTA